MFPIVPLVALGGALFVGKKLIDHLDKVAEEVAEKEIQDEAGQDVSASEVIFSEIKNPDDITENSGDETQGSPESEKQEKLSEISDILNSDILKAISPEKLKQIKDILLNPDGDSGK